MFTLLIKITSQSPTIPLLEKLQYLLVLLENP